MRKQLIHCFTHTQTLCHNSLTWMPKPGPGAKFFTPSWTERFLGWLQLRPSSLVSTIMVLDGWRMARWKQKERIRITEPSSSSTTTEPKFRPSGWVPSSRIKEVGDQVAPGGMEEEQERIQAQILTIIIVLLQTLI